MNIPSIKTLGWNTYILVLIVTTFCWSEVSCPRCWSTNISYCCLLVPQNVCHAAIPPSSSAYRNQLLGFSSFSDWLVVCGSAKATLTEACTSWLPGASWSSAGPGGCYRVWEIWDKKVFILWFQEGNYWICLSFLMLPGMPQTSIRLIQAYFY